MQPTTPTNRSTHTDPPPPTSQAQEAPGPRAAGASIPSACQEYYATMETVHGATLQYSRPTQGAVRVYLWGWVGGVRWTGRVDDTLEGLNNMTCIPPRIHRRARPAPWPTRGRGTRSSRYGSEGNTGIDHHQFTTTRRPAHNPTPTPTRRTPTRSGAPRASGACTAGWRRPSPWPCPPPCSTTPSTTPCARPSTPSGPAPSSHP